VKGAIKKARLAFTIGGNALQNYVSSRTKTELEYSQVFYKLLALSPVSYTEEEIPSNAIHRKAIRLLKNKGLPHQTNTPGGGWTRRNHVQVCWASPKNHRYTRRSQKETNSPYSKR